MYLATIKLNNHLFVLSMNLITDEFSSLEQELDAEVVERT